MTDIRIELQQHDQRAMQWAISKIAEAGHDIAYSLALLYEIGDYVVRGGRELEMTLKASEDTPEMVISITADDGVVIHVQDDDDAQLELFH